MGAIYRCSYTLSDTTGEWVYVAAHHEVVVKGPGAVTEAQDQLRRAFSRLPVRQERDILVDALNERTRLVAPYLSHSLAC